MIARLRRLLPPFGAGRLTPAQSAWLGRELGSVAYIGIGPFLLVFNLPERFQVTDPIATLHDLNARLAEVYADGGHTAPGWVSDLPTS